MSKRIVFCADGTWEAPVNGTNVYRFYKALTVTSDQVTYYDDGVGADAKGLLHLIEGAFGEGLLQKIQDGYTKIGHVFEPGDEIFLFGFSRGAYTARCLAGMIANCGLPTGSFTDDCVTQAFKAYRDPAKRAAILAGLGKCNLSVPTIRMVGVWDTVGSLGIPAIFGGIDVNRYGFLDTGLHPCIKNAYHALAIDERRAQYPATLWTSQPAEGQTIEQVWFAGCHCDVGGGTPMSGGVDGDTRLCDITLAWMMGKAQALDLTFDPAVAAQFKSISAKVAMDAFIESWNLASGPAYLRPIPANASISNSVALRIKYAQTYAPANLTVQNGALASGYLPVSIVDESAV